MSTALAEAAYKAARAKGETGAIKVAFGEHDHVKGAIRAHWSEVFDNNPLIADPKTGWNKALLLLQDYPGRRTSIDYDKCTVDGGAIRSMAFREGFHAPRGTICFSAEEIVRWSVWHGPLDVVIEPNVKGEIGPNKSWPWERWEALADGFIAQGVEVAQFVYPEARLLETDSIRRIRSGSFREGCFALSRSRLLIATDSGLHHAAAALAVPAVVLWSHFSSPDVYGYDFHVNLREAEGRGCGTLWKECEECRKSMEKITVESVLAAALAERASSAGLKSRPQPSVSPASMGPATDSQDGGPVFRTV